MRRVIACIASLFITIPNSHGQFYSSGADPWHTRWQHIDYGPYRIIFDSLDIKSAQYMATILPTQTPDYRRSRFPILLHSSSSISNGMVSWAPRRMEAYTFSENEGDCIPWMLHLTHHEYRHIWQTATIETGMTRALSYIFGQQSTGLILGLFTPKWLLEGDAVWYETRMTNGGRGRDAEWMAQDKALWAEGVTPSYDQAYNGSYAQFIPDYYHMGYMVVDATNRLFPQPNDSYLWESVIKQCGRCPISLFPFNRTLRRLTSFRRNALYYHCMEQWHQQWDNEINNITPTEFSPLISSSARYYSSYANPQQTKENNIIAYRVGTSTIPAFITIDRKGNEEVKCYPSPRDEENFDIHDNILIWAERHNNPRWTNGSKSVLCWIDIHNNSEKHYIKPDNHYEHYSSPRISPDGKKICCIAQSKEHERLIVLVESMSDVVDTLRFTFPNEPLSPAWIDNENIALITVTEQGKSIECINLKTHRRTSLVGPSYNNIRHLKSEERQLLFSAEQNGIQNIYKISLDSDTLPLRVTSSQICAGWPSLTSDGSLLYCEYSALGYKPVIKDLSVIDTLHISSGSHIHHDSSTSDITPKPYSQWNLLNPHSWGPVIVDTENATLTPGLSISSQNPLNSMITQAFLRFGNDSGDEHIGASLIYDGWLPRLSCEWTYGEEKIKGNFITGIEHTANKDTLYWACLADGNDKIAKFQSGLTLPLQWSRGAWIRGFNVGIKWQWQHFHGVRLTGRHVRRHGHRDDVFDIVEIPDFTARRVSSLNYSLSASIMRRIPHRTVGTRYGIALSTVYAHSVGATDYGRLLSGALSIYLPGILPTHHTTAYIGFQHRKASSTNDSYQYDSELSIPRTLLHGNIIPVARGWSRIESSRYTLMRLNYALPVIDPDWSIGPVIYIKRIIARPFYDRAWGRAVKWGVEEKSHLRYTQSSFGVELTAISHIAQLPFPISLGVRVSRTIENKSLKSEMLLNISFSN